MIKNLNYKRLFWFCSTFSIGLFIGGNLVWISTHLPNLEQKAGVVSFESILKHTNTEITKDNFSCEHGTSNNVGAVVGSILAFNAQNIRNKISLGCFKKKCHLTISDCKPWQSSECSSRFLAFDLNKENQIIPTSFACFDMP